MKTITLKIVFSATVIFGLAASRSLALNHLATPSIYDNASGFEAYGQTFVADSNFMSGVQVYIGDPSRPNDPSVNGLDGPATLSLYNLSTNSLLASSQIVPSGTSVFGLSTFHFDTPAQTTVGSQYFFGISSADTFGIGLRQPNSSTYDGGAEAWRNPTSGQITQHFNGRDLSFNVLTDAPQPRLPTQNVVLAWGESAPFALHGAFGAYFDTPGTTSAASLTQQYKTDVLSKVRQIFAESGITNINITDTPTPDATIVYFSDQNLSISGKTIGGVDRFNHRPDDKVIVFTLGTSPGGTANDDSFATSYDAESAAHEIGHSLGLLHVNPGTRTTPTGVTIKEVMYAPEVSGAEPRFINAVSDHESFDPTDTLWTHNPLYHLERYVDGYTDSELRALSILPGRWDLPQNHFEFHLGFSETQRMLYNVSLLTSTGDSDSLASIAHFDQITLEALQALHFDIEADMALTLFASSTSNGPIDIALASGDPNTQSNLFIQPVAGQVSASLQMQTGQGTFTTIDTATITGTVVPEPTSVLLLLFSALFFLHRRSLRTHERSA